ncbi:MAG TPA: STAS domain-containing protein [Terriglobales bacterium]|nr:STAS domain-containing protein [Terriglobales bacterium]
MAIVAEWLKMDNDHLLETLESARAKLISGECELVLDFSSVKQLDSAALNRVCELAASASEKKARVGLKSVNVAIYRVLKTAQIASSFIFLD